MFEKEIDNPSSYWEGRTLVSENLPVGLRVVETRSKGAWADGVDSRTITVEVVYPHPAPGQVDLNTGKIRGDSRGDEWALTINDLQKAREAVELHPLASEEIDKLKRDRFDQGYRRTQFTIPSSGSTASWEIVPAEPQNDGCLPRVLRRLASSNNTRVS